eukprot:2924093-Rhodomonas_salina.2
MCKDMTLLEVLLPLSPTPYKTAHYRLRRSIPHPMFFAVNLHRSSSAFCGKHSLRCFHSLSFGACIDLRRIVLHTGGPQYARRAGQRDRPGQTPLSLNPKPQTLRTYEELSGPDRFLRTCDALSCQFAGPIRQASFPRTDLCALLCQNPCIKLQNCVLTEALGDPSACR